MDERGEQSPSFRQTPENRLTQAVRQLRRQGFHDEQIASLLTMKLRYNEGHYRDDTIEQKRLIFARWMYNKGIISS